MWWTVSAGEDFKLRYEIQLKFQIKFWELFVRIKIGRDFA